jgi:hypothetical protein
MPLTPHGNWGLNLGNNWCSRSSTLTPTLSSDWIETAGWDLPLDPETFFKFVAGREATPAQQRTALAAFLNLPDAHGPCQLSSGAAPDPAACGT